MRLGHLSMTSATHNCDFATQITPRSCKYFHIGRFWDYCRIGFISPLTARHPVDRVAVWTVVEANPEFGFFLSGLMRIIIFRISWYRIMKR